MWIREQFSVYAYALKSHRKLLVHTLMSVNRHQFSRNPNKYQHSITKLPFGCNFLTLSLSFSLCLSLSCYLPHSLARSIAPCTHFWHINNTKTGCLCHRIFEFSVRSISFRRTICWWQLVERRVFIISCFVRKQWLNYYAFHMKSMWVPCYIYSQIDIKY